MTQKDRVLRILRKVPGGVTRLQFLAPNVIDGGGQILNVPARIEELRKEGHDISSSGTRHGCALYVLKSSGMGVSSALPAAPASSPGAAGTLFDPAIVNRPAGAYDEIDEAA